MFCSLINIFMVYIDKNLVFIWFTFRFKYEFLIYFFYKFFTDCIEKRYFVLFWTNDNCDNIVKYFVLRSHKTLSKRDRVPTFTTEILFIFEVFNYFDFIMNTNNILIVIGNPQNKILLVNDFFSIKKQVKIIIYFYFINIYFTLTLVILQ